MVVARCAVSIVPPPTPPRARDIQTPLADDRLEVLILLGLHELRWVLQRAEYIVYTCSNILSTKYY